MPAKITFTQKEQSALEDVILLAPYGVDISALQKLLEKMEGARTKETTKFHGVGVGKVMEMARSQFGARFKTPNMITKEWTIRMQTIINQNGVDEATAAKAIKNCNWTGDIFAQTLIYKLAELAVTAPRTYGKGTPVPTKKTGWLAQLEDDNGNQDD
jgi:hypothetical protein